MPVLYNFALFIITLLGGSVPLWYRGWNEQRMKYLLAFSGAFLLGITLLHLLPETMHDHGHGHGAGLLVLAGFFLQQVIQRFTHGVEHGHMHVHTHRPASFLPVFAGLALHAFSEGLPLGIAYTDRATLPSLYLAIALHKLPEAMLITSLAYVGSGKKGKAWPLLVLFSLITPVSGLLSFYLGTANPAVEEAIRLCVPLIAVAFLHIATTIFFESGTRSHEMNRKKWLATFAGIGAAVLTLLGGGH